MTTVALAMVCLLAGSSRDDVVLDQVHLAFPLPEGLKPKPPRSGDLLIYEAQGVIGEVPVTLEVVRFPGARSLADVSDALEEIYRQNQFEFSVKLAANDEHQGFTVTQVEYEVKQKGREAVQLGRLLAFDDVGVAVFLRAPADRIEKIRNDLEEILETLKITVKAPDPQWSDADAKARIAEIFTPAQRDAIEIARTKHYIIFTNSSAGKLFGKELEDIYARFQKVYPFADQKSDRLLPVYLFKMREEYIDFYARYAQIDKAAAARSAGHSWKDYYATSYTDPHDLVHSHEGAHQIVKMRLRLPGGGSWFQEGIAEYFEHMDKPSNLKNSVKSLLNRKRELPLRKLMAVESLLQDAPVDPGTGDASRDYYSEAATLIWFFHKGPHKAKFMDLIKRVGRLRRNDVPAIEAQLKEVLGVSIEQLEEQWKAFVLKL